MSTESFNKDIITVVSSIKQIIENVKLTEEIVKQIPKNYKIGADDPEPKSVFYIDPRIEAEYNALIGKSMPMKNLMEHYLDWSEVVLLLFRRNKDNLWNSKLTDSLLESFRIVKTVYPTLKQSSLDLNWDSLFSDPE